jgi:quinol-cytochrome oxidoreductase complex cytochrome b subunit
MVLPALLRDPARHPDKLGGVLAMFGAIVILAFLPWLDTSKVARDLPAAVQAVLLDVRSIVCVVLGYLGSQPAEGIYVTILAYPDGAITFCTSWSSCRCSASSRRRSRCRLDLGLGAEGGGGRSPVPAAPAQGLSVVAVPQGQDG